MFKTLESLELEWHSVSFLKADPQNTGDSAFARLSAVCLRCQQRWHGTWAMKVGLGHKGSLALQTSLCLCHVDIGSCGEDADMYSGVVLFVTTAETPNHRAVCVVFPRSSK